MVAPRNRLTALWLVALMISSTLVAFAPMVAATHGSMPTTPAPNLNPNLLILRDGLFKQYSTLDPVMADRVVNVGDTVRFYWNITWPAPTPTADGPGDCDSGGVLPADGVGKWAIQDSTIDAGGTDLDIIAPSIANAATEQNPTTINVENSNFRAQVIYEKAAAATSAAAGENANAIVQLRVLFTCVKVSDGLPATPAGVTETQNFDSPGFSVDTILPVVSSTAMGVERECVIGACNGGSAVGDQNIAGIGSSIKFTPSMNADGTALEVNYNGLFDGAGSDAWVPVTKDVQIGKIVKAPGAVESGTLVWRSLPGSTPAIQLRARDAAGNEAAPITVTWAPRSVDNVLPDPGAGNFGITTGTLTRRASGIDMTLAWAGSGAAFARGTVTHPGGTCSLGFWAGVQSFSSLCEITTNTYAAALNITLHPVDAAGNINTAYVEPDVTPPSAPSPGFPSGVTVEYGGEAIIPPSVKGDGFKWVYVNVSEKGPILPYPTAPTPVDQNDLRIVGKLQRDFTATAPGQGSAPIWGAPRYWRDGTGGNNLGDDTNTGHFQTGQNLDVSDSTIEGGSRTVFRPEPTATGQGAYIMKNLSGKSFTDGHYRLIVDLTSPAPYGLHTVIVRDVHVDGADPKQNAHRNFTGTPTLAAPALAVSGNGPSSNSTQAAEIHGMDNNPLRVVVNTTDWDSVAHTDINKGRKDSGFRNLSVELIDAVTEQVVPRTGGGLAQVQITPTSCVTPGASLTERATKALAYCIRMPAGDPVANPTSTSDVDCPGAGADTCIIPSCKTTTAQGLDVQNITDCAWDAIAFKGRWNTTFVNETQFSGFVNVTWPDLPAGKYKVRVSIWDNANRNKTSVYGPGADLYKVAPAVSLVSNTESPLRTEDNRLVVTALASQRFLTPPTGRPCSAIQTDTCAADHVLLYVSDANGPTDQGVQYGDAITNISALAELNPAAPLQLKGWTIANPWNGTQSLASNFPVRLFPYSQGAQENLPQLPVALRTGPIFVRAVAIAVDGSGAEIIRSSTDWIPVISLTQQPIRVNQPSHDFQLNVTSQYDTNPSTAKRFGPPFNVTFNRTTDALAPVMEYQIYELNRSADIAAGTAVPLASVTGVAPDLVNGAAPRMRFNWTGELKPAGNANLAAGVYHFHVKIKQAASDTTLLAEIRRNFTILQDSPQVWINSSNLTNGIRQRDGTSYVAPNFEVPFKVNHSFANVTLDNVELQLRRASFGPGQSPIVRKGEENFDYTLDSPAVHESLLATDIVANVTLPPASPSGTTFQLQIVVNLTSQSDALPDGNPTQTLTLRIDKQPPSGRLRVPESESTVFVLNSNPPRNKAMNDPARAPAFRGFAEDLGAGPTRVEVRIFDVTTDTTIRVDPNLPRGFTSIGGLSDSAADWANSNDNGAVKGYTSGGATVAYGTLTGTRREWIIDVSTIEDTDDTSGDPGFQPGIINMSHTYRVDVRVTDGLGSILTTPPTLFDFDAAPPTLGHLGSLNSTTSQRSGLNVTTNRVAWHGSLRISVNVTDNQCIAAVRLKGNNTLTPNLTLVAPMTRVGGSGGSYVCYEDMPRNTLATGLGTKFAEYEVDLAAYPNFTDHVMTYKLWWEAEDAAGQISEIPVASRNFQLEVFDNSPATVRSLSADPSPGQAGGRALIRADVFDNDRVDRVLIRVTKLSNNQLVGSGTMRPENVSASGVGRYVVDTQADLNVTLETGDYNLNVTAYDPHWNRTVNPTCPQFLCIGIPSFIYRVRDDGPPAVVLESPSDNSTVNATPVFKIRALGRNVQTPGITVVAGVDGAQANVPAANLTFTELTATNGTRQGYTVTYAPGPLADNATFTVNVSVDVAGLLAEGNYRFRVDALPPTVSANVSRTETIGSKTWIAEDTRVTLTATDNVSATSVKFKVNTGAEQTYSGPIDPSGPDGDWRLEYWAVDAAGNAAAHQTLTLALDATGPRISVAQTGDDMLLTVSDAGVGLNESSVVVHYRYGEAVSFATLTAEKGVGNTFRAVLPGNASATGLAFYVTALDLLGRTGSNGTAAQPIVIPCATCEGGEGGEGGGPNLPPTVRITQPTTGASLRNTLELRWLAEDPEDAPLTISIALRDPPPGRVLVPAGENSGTYNMNLSGLPAGAYTLVVTANDGENSATSTVTFNVVGPAIQPRDPPPPTVQPQTPVPITVALEPAGKTVAQVTYRIVKDGQTVGTGRLTPTQGVYSATYVPQEPGAYRVVVDVAYADGTTEPSQQVAAFTVPGDGPTTGARSFPSSLMVLVAIAVLTVALAGYGAFGRWKK